MDLNALSMGLDDPLLPTVPAFNPEPGIDDAEAFFDFAAFTEQSDADMLDAEHTTSDFVHAWSQFEDQSHPSVALDFPHTNSQLLCVESNTWYNAGVCYNTGTADNDETVAGASAQSTANAEAPSIPSISAAALDLEAGTWLPGLALLSQDDSHPLITYSMDVTPVDPLTVILPKQCEKHVCVERRKTSRRSKTTPNPVPKRACISSEAKLVLDTHFGINPYPKEHEITSLLQKTKLTGRTIKTWFSNTRSRRGVAMFSTDRVTESDPTQLAQRQSPTPSSISGVTRTSLERLNHLSPASSIISLERYLSEPMSDDSDSMDAVESAAYLAVDHKNLHKLSGSTLNEASSMYQYGTFGSQRAKSIADSEASFGSFKSLSSHNSVKTVDSRGCRRGRKRWFRTRADATNKPFDMITGRDEKKRPRFFCTWSSCAATFRHRYEWIRHEEALHYQPNHWICCLEEARPRTMPSCIICGKRSATLAHMVERHSPFNTCLTKCQDSRTFFREDQLVQHIKGAHLGQETTKRSIENLLCNWKVVNPAFDEANLKCGFCGLTLESWEERQQHVSKHLQSGICKMSWWPERLPLVPTVASINRNDPFTCPNCSHSTTNFTTAFFSHSHCITYSCRNLHDLHAAFITKHFDADAISSTCRLCNWAIAELNDKNDVYLQRLAEHADTHGLRNCNQDVFTSPDEFVKHLNSVHGAKWQAKNDLALEGWRCDQNLVQSPKGCCVQTKVRSHGRPLCCTEAYYQVVETPCV